MFETRNASTRYRLRLHRARSVVLSPQELVEIRAAQRTFEGAYIRTSLSQFSFALIVLKIFTSEFYSIGNLSTADPSTNLTIRRCAVCSLWSRRTRRECLQAYARQPAVFQRGWRGRVE
jgi:hypothetical protein